MSPNRAEKIPPAAPPAGETQKSVVAFCEWAFGPVEGNGSNLFAMLLEEVVELGVEMDQPLDRMLEVVRLAHAKSKRQGDFAGEIADVDILTKRLADHLGIDSDSALAAKMARNRSRDRTYYDGKQAAKRGSGLLAPKPEVSAPEAPRSEAPTAQARSDRDDEVEMENQRLVYVLVEPASEMPADSDVMGAWMVSISPSAPAHLVEEAALEAFHCAVAIEEIDGVEIRVLDLEGRPLEGQDRHAKLREVHPLESWGCIEGQWNIEDLPFEAASAGAAGSAIGEGDPGEEGDSREEEPDGPLPGKP